MKLIDISEWKVDEGATIGKRIKKVVTHPDTFDLYYFKEPEEKYAWEFWSEIIAYKIGRQLGFNVLEYKPAISGENVGCLSKSMVDIFTQELRLGQQYLQRIKPNFETKKGTDHTFELVEKFFSSNIVPEELIYDFIEMLVFDAVIGNRDRHQQNWAIIEETEEQKKIISLITKKKSYSQTFRFSPIFDNGNSLAYNILEKDLDIFLVDENKLEKYLFGNKAIAHLKWERKSISHIELLKHIHYKYSEPIDKAIKRIKNLYNENVTSEIVSNVDKGITFAEEKYSLSLKRKELIIKIITNRTNKLLQELL